MSVGTNLLLFVTDHIVFIVASIITELPLSVTSGIGKDIYNSFNNK